MHAFDLATGKPGKTVEIKIANNSDVFAWDPVFRHAAVINFNGVQSEISIVDADSGKTLFKQTVWRDYPFIAFASHNRDRMAIFSRTEVIGVVNPTTGNAVQTFEPGDVVGRQGGISPDGRLIVAPTRTMSVWEVSTGKKRFTLDAIRRTELVSFSADSRFMAVWDVVGVIVVVDLRTGTTVGRYLPGGQDNVVSLALSRDGKRLAAGSATGRVTIWDLASGTILAPFAGHDGPVTGLVFTTDANRLVSSSQDGTALVWQVPEHPLAVRTIELAPIDFDEAFRLLGSTDAAQAQRGLAFLYLYPAEAVNQTRQRMPTPSGTAAAGLAKLVADLTNDDFSTREAALKTLEMIGGEAKPLLQEVARKSESPEARKLAGELLGKIDAPAHRPGDLRILRLVEFLENLRTREARRLLETWARGPAGHRLTTEAAAAIERIKETDSK